MTSLPIKTTSCAILLAVLLSVPAEAAQARKRVPPPSAPAAPSAPALPPAHRGANLFPPGPVIYGNKNFGTDPDPFIRQQLLRDLGAQF